MAMVRLLGMRLLTRLLLFVCFLSMASLLLLSRCGLGNLEDDVADEQDTQTGPGMNTTNNASNTSEDIVAVLESMDNKMDKLIDNQNKIIELLNKN